jgi:hypothetical protein
MKEDVRKAGVQIYTAGIFDRSEFPRDGRSESATAHRFQ